MPPRAKDKECYQDDDGNRWEIFYVIYDSTTGDPGDYDEVMELRKNGNQEGHVTYHKDKNGVTKKENTKGNINLPRSARRVSC